MGKQDEMLRLIQDEDSHWYVIPVSEVARFYEWDRAVANNTSFGGTGFDSNMVDGPHSVTFPSYKLS